MGLWDVLAAIAPELILAIGATDLLLLAAFSRNPRVDRTISISAVVLLLVAATSLLGPASYAGDVFGGQYRADGFAAFAKALIFIGSAVAIAMAPGFFRRFGEMEGEFPVLILFSAIGMGIMVSAGDLLMLYVGLELQSLSAYVLASFLRRDARSAEAGLKYFVLGALASGILLYGISLLYGFTGTTMFDGIAAALRAQAGGEEGLGAGALFGLVFVFAGLAFKISAVPFHMWTPDVYEGAPTPVTAFFASAPKVAAMALMVRVAMEAMGPATDAWRQIVIFSALASTVLGGVAAIGQRNVKRLLAYSSINNIGFALIGLAAGTREGAASVLFYMAVYMVMTLGAFLVVLRMRDAEGRPVEAIDSLSGLSRSRPGLALAMALFMFSLAGIPPLMGFWPKFYVFLAAVQADLTWLAAVGIATSVIGAYY
ncbi:MAG: NADH-quinone oxidoreductase subunit NuoN, partial [Pseudomonadota bacterium]|nr:NADH-quinone oxidoreductase subunit NuoN [Pseudomonadota bacterium]